MLWKSYGKDGSAYGIFGQRYARQVDVAFSAPESRAAESSGSALVRVTLTNRLGALSPAPVTVSYASADGTATAGQDYTAVSGQITFPIGSPSGTGADILVPLTRDLLDEPDETLTLHLTSADPSVLGPVTVHTLTIEDSDPAPSILVDDAAVPEPAPSSGPTTLSFPVRLSNPSASQVSVSYATADGSATAGQDYTAASGMVVFPAGSTSQTVTVQVLADDAVEGSETVFLDLSSPVGGALGDFRAVGTILDEDQPASVSVGDAAAAEGAAVPFHLSLSAAVTRQVSVPYATGGGSATAGQDYSAASGTVVFPPGSTAQTVEVQTLQDGLVESNESFFLDLSAPSGATLANSQAQGTILDDDLLPVLGIADAPAVVEGNSGSPQAVFSLTLSRPAPAAVTVTALTIGLDAFPGADFTPIASLVTLPQNATSATVAVSVLPDLLDEPDEKFAVVLLNPSGAVLGRSAALGTILDDDPPPSVSIADVSVSEDQPPPGALFPVSLSSPSGRPVSVHFATADGTALAGQDYQSASGSLSFPPGSVQQFVAVSILSDSSPEPPESFKVDLSAPQNATLSRPEATGTIVEPLGLGPLPVALLPLLAAGLAFLVRLRLRRKASGRARVGI